jgi:hypothetical protein
VRAGAFGDGLPHRDLFLSPDHAVFMNGVLIPIKCLVNDISITRTPIDQITYYHIQLPRHEVLLAEGLAVESYLDRGDRSNFEISGDPVRLFPDFSADRGNTSATWEMLGCARLVIVGPELDAARILINSFAANVASALQHGQAARGSKA